MTEDEAKIVAREAVRETLQLIGLDVSNPGELQRDFHFIRSWRQSTEAVRRQSLLTIVGIITAGILGLVYLAFRGTQ